MWLFLGSIASLAAFLIRQTTLVTPAAFALFILLRYRSAREPLKNLAAVLVLPIVGAAAFLAWYHFVQGVPATLDSRALAPIGAMLSRAPGMTFRILGYLGLFLLPLWVGTLGRIGKRPRRAVFLLWGALFCAGMIYLAARSEIKLPYGRNIPFYLGDVLTDLGLGPRTLRDAFLLGRNIPFQLPPMVWLVVSLIGALGMAFVGTELTLHLWRHRGRLERLADPLLLSALLTMMTFLALDYIFDRYVIALIPGAVVGVLLMMEDRRVHLVLPVLVATCFLIFSMMGVADYMHWNDARWEAARFAVDRLGCPPEQVDGGFEWGGWMNYDKFDRLPETDPASPVSWWWVRRPRYVVTFGPLDWRRTVETFPYASPFSRDPQRIMLLETSAGESGTPQRER